MELKGPLRRLGATDSGPRPGRFPLGSARSRAAARALLETKRDTEEAGVLIVLRLIGTGNEPGHEERKCTCPVPPAGTVALCRCFE